MLKDHKTPDRSAAAERAQRESKTKSARRAAKAPPWFDPVAVRRALDNIARAHAGDETACRQRVLEQLKSVVGSARQKAQLAHEKANDGLECAAGLSCFQDELIKLIFDFATGHVYRVENPSRGERMAIVATGGYGRALLAPGSDIDLLFLLPYKQTAWGESVVEFILYLLWDLGFKVGHAARSAGQSVRASREDMTIRTTLLDARLIKGDSQLFDEFHARYLKDVVKRKSREFVEAKLDEREDRHEKHGTSRYSVEPNIKEGKGGLRDLHLLHWLEKDLQLAARAVNETTSALLSPEERTTFKECERFLWTVRCHLHFLTGRAEERLSFDVQAELAQRLGYMSDEGMQAVERFMTHYFGVAKEVGDLTRIVCSALELKQLKSTPRLYKFLGPFKRRPIAGEDEFAAFTIENGRISVVDDDAFTRDPVNLIRLFVMAEAHNVLFHPQALRLVRASLPLIDDGLRNDREANRLFLELLSSPSGAEESLRRMNEAGVLGRFIPEFGHVVSMMQFNMYHHYTVDEHLIRSVGILSDIDNGRCAEQHPLSTEIIGTIENRQLLYVAMLLHDIAKGRDEDHSLAGAGVARALCPRLGFSLSETANVAWLVEHHLDMSHFAQSRDLGDAKTIRDFAAVVQSRERLKLLLILTVADIRAVGPGVWNGWKGELLRTLYYETEAVLSGGLTKHSHKKRVQTIKDRLRAKFNDWPAEVLDQLMNRHYDAYWMRTSDKRLEDDFRLMFDAEKNNLPLVTQVTTDAFTDITELAIFAPAHARMLAKIAGACAMSGANIAGAQVSTTRDGMALDVIALQRAFDHEEDELRRAASIEHTLEKLLKGELRLRDVMKEKRAPSERMAAFSVEPQVIIDNTLSQELTVIEINGLDRPGLLFDLTYELSDMKLDIASAHIATYGEKAVDVFYVTNLFGKKIASPDRQTAIRQRLTEVLVKEVRADSEPV